ncbi:hypothetical protein, partial [Escherichia coli]
RKYNAKMEVKLVYFK